MYRIIYSIAEGLPTVVLTFKTEDAMHKYVKTWVPRYAAATYYWMDNEYTPDWVD